MLKESDTQHLNRCIELAREALEAGDLPFGSVLVDGRGTVRAEARNQSITGDPTRHPEFDLARWAGINMTAEERAEATVYTSGEHCPMCSAAHAWAGLGRIVFASSGEQLKGWLSDLGVEAFPVHLLPVQDIAPGVRVDGPVSGLAEQVRELHYRCHE
ncbi:tRNA-specific adenosine deaminase [Halovibrio salipaludis]|uniref:tRNA-specific adenosine deaminase n=1 Tax=Halovibrio salipaludis TaxID=2032626 RepID=A0A2A2F6W0_9GAMM|nr:nucleoside deaminase [Halovibrio salipaludis]PAU80550.1 tRNA-specific adenosine deaminase [Halovibrio salipaludis]